jgi:hypothetical protein
MDEAMIMLFIVIGLFLQLKLHSQLEKKIEAINEKLQREGKP